MWREDEKEEQALAVIGMSSRAEKARWPGACHEDVALALQSRDFAHLRVYRGDLVEKNIPVTRHECLFATRPQRAPWKLNLRVSSC